MTTIILALKLEVTTEHGEDLSDAQILSSNEAIESALATRLFGEGFLPDDIELDTWSTQVIL